MSQHQAVLNHRAPATLVWFGLVFQEIEWAHRRERERRRKANRAKLSRQLKRKIGNKKTTFKIVKVNRQVSKKKTENYGLSTSVLVHGFCGKSTIDCSLNRVLLAVHPVSPRRPRRMLETVHLQFRLRKPHLKDGKSTIHLLK